jgi:putative glutamine amidotransferase
MKPLIGISGSIMKTADLGMDPRFAAVLPEIVTAPRDYVTAVEKAGGIPVVIPVNTCPEAADAILDRLDGLLLTGGDDVDPKHYGEDYELFLQQTNPIRDIFDLNLATKAMEKDMPILGICRGCQILNVAKGGSLYQDISSQVKGSLFHPLLGISPKWHKTHEVVFSPDSKLAAIYGTERLWTNGFHHQAVKKAADTFAETGKTKDGVTEAIESKTHTFVVGVQWHPEMMLEKYEEVLPLFEAFVEAAKTKK